MKRVSSAVASVNNDTISNSDFDENLFNQCLALRDMPLCTLSSFHTIGEQMKIDLSSFEDGNGSVSKLCLGFRRGMATSTDDWGLLFPIAAVNFNINFITRVSAETVTLTAGRQL